jgi:uncharacterized protein (TIGR00297 family)
MRNDFHFLFIVEIYNSSATLFKTFCGIIDPGMRFAIVFSLIILATIFATRTLERKSILEPVISRKVLHIVAIGLSAVSVFYIEIDVLRIIALSCLPILVFIVAKGFFRDPQTGRKSWGIVYFNLVFAALLFLFPSAPDLIFYPLMILAVGDGLAAIVGVSAGTRNRKSIQGYLAFFFSSLLIFTLSPKFYPVSDLPIQTALILSLSLAAVELITNKSLDNLTVPAAAVYWMIVDHLSNDSIGFIVPGIMVGCWLIYKLKWLNRNGSILAGIIALVYLSSPFPDALIPGFIFFATGSMLSKLPPRDPKEDSRSAVQVFSNGGPALISICLYFTTEDYAWFLASIVSFSAALSDTASSELGIRFSSRTFDILGLRNLQKGASGGVSIAGFFYGIIASCFLAITTALFIDLSLAQIGFIALFGFAGNITDSILGSTLQFKSFQTTTGFWTDENQVVGAKSAGIGWFDNNLTNLVSISAVTILSYFFF